MRDWSDEPFEIPACVCGCPEGGSHVDHVTETLEPCGTEGCPVLLCGACRCPQHGTFRTSTQQSLT